MQTDALLNWMTPAGVMLSLSMVHVIADSFEELQGLAGDFPVASLFVIVGIYLMSAAENISISCFHHQVPDRMNPTSKP